MWHDACTFPTKATRAIILRHSRAASSCIHVHHRLNLSPGYTMATGIAEAATVYSLVTGTIELIKTAIEIYQAVRDKDKLPQKLHIVAERLPSIEQLLATSEQQSYTLPADTWVAVHQNVQRCYTCCEEMRDIFEKAFPQAANVMHRVWTGAVTILSGKGKRAEELLREVSHELEVLGQHHVVSNTELLAEIKASVDQLGVGDGSVYQHFGSGPLGVNPASGTQTINRNSGSGNWFQGPVHSPTFHAGTK